MHYYTLQISPTLAEKLKENGMPIEYHPLFTPEIEGADKSVGLICPTFGACLDWLMSRGYRIIIHTKPANEPILWFAYIATMEPDYCIIGDTRDCFSWHEAAEKAIEKALTLI